MALAYLIELFDLAIRRIEEAGINRKNAFYLLNPLIEETLSNIEKVGAQKALIGPLARRDIKTVEKRLEEIGSKKPELLSLYKRLAFYTVDIAATGHAGPESIIWELKKLTV